MKTVEIIKLQIEKGGFSCVEDAIDEIQRFYKMGHITLEQRNELFKMV